VPLAVGLGVKFHPAVVMVSIRTRQLTLLFENVWVRVAMPLDVLVTSLVIGVPTDGIHVVCRVTDVVKTVVVPVLLNVAWSEHVDTPVLELVDTEGADAE
jgi:hypothetical protein